MVVLVGPVTPDSRQQLVSFENPNNQIHPFWGWSVQIAGDRLYFLLLKPGEPGTDSTQTEKYVLMTLPNKMVFFDCWNTLVLSCQNHFQKKVSELTISLNNKVRVIKLSIDRETLFHSFDLVKRESSNTVLLPTLSVHHLLNDLHLFRNFQGRVSQVLVFKEQLRSSEIHALGSLLSSVEELGVLDSHLKMRGWIKNHHLSSKIALDFNSFDLRHRHISFLHSLALI